MPSVRPPEFSTRTPTHPSVHHTPHLYLLQTGAHNQLPCVWGCGQREENISRTHLEALADRSEQGLGAVWHEGITTAHLRGETACLPVPCDLEFLPSSLAWPLGPQVLCISPTPMGEALSLIPLDQCLVGGPTMGTSWVFGQWLS